MGLPLRRTQEIQGTLVWPTMLTKIKIILYIWCKQLLFITENRLLSIYVNT